MSVRIAIAQINSTVGDLEGNADRIARFARSAAEQGADIVVTPELSLTGYPPEDLLLDASFYRDTQAALNQLAQSLKTLMGLHVLVGHHLERDGKRFNACSILIEGRIIQSYCKQDLPNHSVFDEKRYFEPGTAPCVFTVKHRCFGINICEDVWSPAPPLQAKEAGAEILLIQNSSPYNMSKLHERVEIVRRNVSKTGMTAIYANLVGGQDELVFDGNSFVLNADGQVCLQLTHCEEALSVFRLDALSAIASNNAPARSLESEVYDVLLLGTRDYILKNGFPGVLLGLSGGVDSALVLAIAVDALGKDKVRAVMMPSPYTADISLEDAGEMARRLDVRYDILPIQDCFAAFEQTLATQFRGLSEDITEENLQARIRGTLLMALSNKTGSLVLTTGNKSEMAVGYCTLYGDMAGGFAVLRDVPKTLVYSLCRYRNTLSAVIPGRILTRAPSAELRPDQKDQDSLPPYAVLDAVVQLFMEEEKSLPEIVEKGYDHDTVSRILQLIRRNEYKRRQAPVGIRITPRGFGRDWRHPITSRYIDH